MACKERRRISIGIFVKGIKFQRKEPAIDMQPEKERHHPSGIKLAGSTDTGIQPRRGKLGTTGRWHLPSEIVVAETATQCEVPMDIKGTTNKCQHPDLV